MLLTKMAPTTLASATGKSSRKNFDDIFEMKARRQSAYLMPPPPIGDGDA